MRLLLSIVGTVSTMLIGVALGIRPTLAETALVTVVCLVGLTIQEW